MTKGTSPAGAHLYPAFPYPSYQHMRFDDLRDLFAFLKTLPPVAGRVRDHDLPFPFNIRRTLGVWKLLFLDGEPFAPDTSQTAQWNRGAYLVTGPAIAPSVIRRAIFSAPSSRASAYRRSCARRAGRRSQYHPIQAQSLDARTSRGRLKTA